MSVERWNVKTDRSMHNHWCFWSTITKKENTILYPIYRASAMQCMREGDIVKGDMSISLNVCLSDLSNAGAVSNRMDIIVTMTVW